MQDAKRDAMLTCAAPTIPRPVPLNSLAAATMAPLLYADTLGAPTVRQLCQPLPPVALSTLCGEVLRLFQYAPHLYALPVVNIKNVPRALIERHAFVEYFSRTYSIDLFGKKPLSYLFKATSLINTQPIIVDASTSIDDVAAIIIAAGMQHMVSGFIVTEAEGYLGIANGHDLLNHITQCKQAELHYLAHYDQLTGIPNRMLMADRLNMACREANRNGTVVGMMFIDLDRFKQINDTMGHGCGDQLLRSVAERLVSCLRSNDTIARLGGDEFAVLLPNLPDAGGTEVSAQRILDCFHQPFLVHEHELFITASLGVAIYPRDEPDSSKLLAKADAAMYEAKQSGRNAIRHYTAERDASA